MNMNFCHQQNEYQKTADHILAMADTMAAAASMFNSHGYDVFINSRQNLIDTLKELEKRALLTD